MSNFIRNIFKPIIQYYDRIKAEIEEQKRKAELRKQRIEFIKTKGDNIRAIHNLNHSFNFKNVESYQRFKRQCNSKAQLDNFNIDNHMLLTIEDCPSFFIGLVKTIDYNRKKYSQYKIQYDKIMRNCSNISNYMKYAIPDVINANELQDLEKKECQKLKITNVVENFIIELIVYYRSPQGRNEYTRTYKFNYSNIKYYLNEFQKMQQNKQSAVYQRQLMTPKLRYEIMKRDKFKCVICGRSQMDGAKLHVDHIKPVSKGGKTEKSNLRTLCDMCNLGKSNSYDPHGLN